MKNSHWLLAAALFAIPTAIAFLSLTPTAEAMTTVGTGTVTGRVYTWGTVSTPLPGCRVELRSGIGNNLIAWKNTNSSGYFTFSGVQTSTNQSFKVVASPGNHQANWYFTLNPGQTRNRNPFTLSFWP